MSTSPTENRVLHILINHQIIPHANLTKYLLCMTLDVKLSIKEHVKKKYEELVIKLEKTYWLLGKMCIRDRPQTIMCLTLGL